MIEYYGYKKEWWIYLQILFLTFCLDENQRVVYETMKSRFEEFGCTSDVLDLLSFDLNVLPLLKNQCFDSYVAGRFCSKLDDILKEQNYDSVVCLHSHACLVASAVRKRRSYKFSLFSVEIDYSFHKEYAKLNADKFFITSDKFLSKYCEVIDENKIETHLVPTKSAVVQNKLISDFCLVFSDSMDKERTVETVEAAKDIYHTVLVANKDFNYFKDKLKRYGNVSIVTDVNFDFSNCKAIICSVYSIYKNLAVDKNIPLIFLSLSSDYKSEEYINLSELGIGVGALTSEDVKNALSAFKNCLSALSLITSCQRRFKESLACRDVCKAIIDYNKKT